MLEPSRVPRKQQQEKKLVHETGTEISRTKDAGKYFKVIPPSYVSDTKPASS
jgi:hypothetical protein